MCFLCSRKILRSILETTRENNLMLRVICIRLARIHRFEIHRTGDSPMNPITPGTSAQYTATPVPTDGVLASPPTWVSSDEANAPVTVDSTGLVATVNVPVSAPATSFELTISYTNADGVVATGSIIDEIVIPAPPVVDVTSFTVARTA
jgi:hypothetical protein